MSSVRTGLFTSALVTLSVARPVFNATATKPPSAAGSMRQTSGALDTTMGGTLLGAGDHDYVTNDQSANAARYDSNRRSVYLPVIRNAMFGLFTAFDYPDASAPIDCRPRTVVAPQALFFMNAPFVDAAAKRIAETLAATTRDSDERVREAFRRTLARDPDAREQQFGEVACEAAERGEAAPHE